MRRATICGFVAVVLEHVRLEALKSDGLEEPRGHDAVGIHVIAGHDDRGPGHAGDEGRAHCAASHRRTSTTSPAIAAAATIAGLINRVRPVGLPWRPLKFRFDDDAEIWRPSSLSGFIPRHIEQPAPRHSKPASMNTSFNPRASAARL